MSLACCCCRGTIEVLHPTLAGPTLVVSVWWMGEGMQCSCRLEAVAGCSCLQQIYQGQISPPVASESSEATLRSSHPLATVAQRCRRRRRHRHRRRWRYRQRWQQGNYPKSLHLIRHDCRASLCCFRCCFSRFLHCRHRCSVILRGCLSRYYSQTLRQRRSTFWLQAVHLHSRFERRRRAARSSCLKSLQF